MRPILSIKSRAARMRGFTLIELAIVLVVTGILAGIIGMFLRRAIDDFADSSRRIALADEANTALHHMRREIQRALPNSVRITDADPALKRFIEFVPVLYAARYCTAGERVNGAAADCAALSDAKGATFDLLGGVPEIANVAGAWAVIYNLGIPGADAYEANAVNRAELAGINGNQLTLAAGASLNPVEEQQRVQIVGTPVTYVCDPVARTLTRYSNYGWLPKVPAQLADLDGAQTQVLNNHINMCDIDYNQATIDRDGLLYLTLQLAQNDERVTLTHAIQIYNTP